ncbi:MAG: hypothetical protein P4M06_08715 [Pandoraea sp.]|nr:hypothetical protein [Pandoraea sp.]MDR3397628.1 hypothetical protein [Pandoraea sp.]
MVKLLSFGNDVPGVGFLGRLPQSVQSLKGWADAIGYDSRLRKGGANFAAARPQDATNRPDIAIAINKRYGVDSERR